MLRSVRGACGLILPTDQLLNLSKPHAVAASGPLAPRIVRPSHNLAAAAGHTAAAATGEADAGVPSPDPGAGYSAAGGGGTGAAANGALPQPAPPPPASALRLLVRPLCRPGRRSRCSATVRVRLIKNQHACLQACL